MTSESLQHISEDTLELYCLGRLSDAEVEPVEEHLLVCHSCQDTLTETEEFLIAVRAATEQVAAEPKVEPWWQRFWQGITAMPKPALAAAACALAVFLILPGVNRGSAVVDMQTMRGPEDAAQAPANTDLDLRLSMAGIDAAGPFELRLADVSGNAVATAPVEQSGGAAVAHLKALNAGSYWARLYAKDELVREYSINVR